MSVGMDFDITGFHQTLVAETTSGLCENPHETISLCSASNPVNEKTKWGAHTRGLFTPLVFSLIGLYFGSLSVRAVATCFPLEGPVILPPSLEPNCSCWLPRF